LRPRTQAVDADALLQVQALIGPEHRDGHPRHMLIGRLHRLNDRCNG